MHRLLRPTAEVLHLNTGVDWKKLGIKRFAE